MRKWLSLLICGLIACLLPGVAFAEESGGADSPVGIQITLPQHAAQYAYRLTDGAIASRVSLAADDSFSVSPERTCGSLVLSWYQTPQSCTVAQLDADGNTISEETIADGMLRSAVTLDAGCASVRVTVAGDCALSEITAYAIASGGTATQTFQPTPEQADLLIITAEPGIEFEELGALIPTYAREQGMKVVVLYVSDYGKQERAYEALDGLISAGYDVYPIFGHFTCDNYDSYHMAAIGFDSEILTDYLKVQIALLNPKVVVTHSLADPAGAHSLVAECALAAARESVGVQKCYTFGAAETASPTVIDMSTALNAYNGKTAAEVAQSAYDMHVSRRVFGRQIDTTSAYTLSYSAVGEDETKNDLFEHIDAATLIAYTPVSPTPAPTAESATPAAVSEATAAPESGAQQAVTPVEKQSLVAALGFDNKAVVVTLGLGVGISALGLIFAYRPLKRRFGKGDAVCFCLVPFALGLAASAVLAGTAPKAGKPAPVSTVESTATTTPEAAGTSAAPVTPAPTVEPTPDPVAVFEQNYYRKEGDPVEVIVSDSEHGHWAYRTDDLGIDIERVSATNSAGKAVTYFAADIHMKDLSEFRPGFGSVTHSGRGAEMPWILARREKAVLWITGDNLIQDRQEQKGILIRDGRVFWSANEADTLAIYPDMSMRTIPKQLSNAETLLEDGVENAYSFGPTLISGGVINRMAKYDPMTRANPRAGIGEIEPGHYIAIVVERRAMRDSAGLTLEEFASLFADYGCETAYNLNGGRSSAMVFMGEQLNSHEGGGPDPDGSVQRVVADGLMFGYSAQVPDVNDPIQNDGNGE